jgi:16S rRNA (guanine1207-N2)-methyltransferase
MYDPWYKSTFTYQALGAKLKVQIPHDVFSTQRIDEGTFLLLENLPKGNPAHILDMGCGYGALGLPIAAKFPNAKMEMVDRDLLAANYSQKNAEENKLTNVDAYGSLGFRAVKGRTFDWILCNIPARIGRPFIEDFLKAGSAKLNANGEIRIVVITDLGPMIREIQTEHQWPIQEVAVGPRHTIFSMTQIPAACSTATSPLDPLTLYLRDEVKVGGLTLKRPFDIGGDDQKRLQVGLPVLIDTLPRKPLHAGQRVLCFRSAYGQLPLICRNRYPDAEVVAIDRDLLGTTFLKINADTLGIAGPKLDIRENAHFPRALIAGESFDLILGELSPSAGEEVTFDELRTIEKFLKPGGEALILSLDKIEKDWVRKYAEKFNRRIAKVLTRETYTVIRLS